MNSFHLLLSFLISQLVWKNRIPLLFESIIRLSKQSKLLLYLRLMIDDILDKFIIL